MRFDAESKKGFFEHLQSRGYCGADTELQAELIRWAKQTEFRFYRDTCLALEYRQFQGLKPFMHQALEAARVHFDDWNVYLSPTFNRFTMSRRVGEARSVRVRSLTFEVESHETSCTVRRQMFVGDSRYRCREYVFPLKGKSRRTRQ